MKIAVIPDTQCKPGVPEDHLTWIGQYILEQRPDVIVHLGDHADMPSLSSYDEGKKSFEGRRYIEDIDASNRGMEKLLAPIKKYNAKRALWKAKQYKPRMVLTNGNHECFSDDTQALIWNGEATEWVNIADVNVGDYVFTIEGKWSQVSETHCYEYNGYMDHYLTNKVDLLVTPNHRIYYKDLNKGDVRNELSSKIPNSFDFIVASESHGSVNLPDYEVMLNAWLHTDSYHGAKYPILYQSGRKGLYLKRILDEAGIHYNFKERDRDVSEICGRKLKSIQTTYEFHLLEGYSIKSNKYIDPQVWEFDKETFDRWLSWMCFFDGTTPTRAKKSLVFYGMLPIIEDLQKHLLSRGYRATITEYRENNFRLNITNTDKSRFDTKKQHIWYEGNVYCVTVPDGENLLVRRNGKCCFSGNSRIQRAIENDAKLDGVIGLQDLDYERWGWEVYPFLEVVEIAGIHFSHYFANPMSGKALGGMVETRLKTLGFSFVQGHQQGKKVGALERNNGDIHRGVIAGSCYLHDEEYKGPQGNGHWRGMLMLHEVCGGNFDLSEVSLDYLCRHYEGCHVYELMQRKYPEIFEQSQWLKRERKRWEDGSS